MSDRQLAKIKRHAADIFIMDPSRIGLYWDKMRTGLEKLQRVGSDDWRPEDMYYSIKSGNSIAFINVQGWDGFMICSKFETFRGPTLWVWAVYAERGTDVAGYWEKLKEFAREEGVERITFSSPRLGWSRAARNYGFKATQITYEMKVD